MTLNRDPEELKKNTDLFWKPDVAVETDAADFLLELLDQKYGPDDWLQG